VDATPAPVVDANSAPIANETFDTFIETAFLDVYTKDDSPKTIVEDRESLSDMNKLRMGHFEDPQ
jgi:hypothetical protein